VFYLKLFIIVFLGGVFFRSFFDFGVSFTLLLLFITIIFLVLAKFGYLFKIRGRIFFIAGVFLLFFALGILRVDLSGGERSLKLERFTGREITAEAVIVSEPEKKEKYTRLIISLGQVGTEEIETKEKILIYKDHYPEFRFGDRIEVTGILRRPKNFSLDFDWRVYLAKDDIYYEIFYPELKLIGQSSKFGVRQSLFSLKNKFIENVNKVIPEPESSLLGGLVVGARQSLGGKLLEDFRKTGIIHIVVLSGYNITIVADSIIKSLSFLPRVVGGGLAIFAITLFAIMTGAGATRVVFQNTRIRNV